MLHILRRNLSVKIISVALAALCWLFVMNEMTPDLLISDQPLTIPLVITGLPQNMVVMTPLPSVRVRLQGINHSTNIKDIYAQIDLSNSEAGEHSFAVKVNSPVGTNVVDIQPTNVKLLLDTVQERLVSVEVVVSGMPADGSQLGTSYVKPSAVNVRGPSSILSTLNSVFVEVNVAGATETVQVSRPVSIRDEEGNPIIGPNPRAEFLSVFPSAVDVIVPVIAKGLAAKSVPVKVAGSGTPARGKVLRALIPSQTAVQVLGTEQSLAGFAVLDLGLVDVTDLKEDKLFQFTAEKIQLPQGISLYEGTTLSVVAQIESEIVQREVSGLEVQLRNLGTGLVLERPIEPLTITVEGSPDVLDSIKPDQIQLWIDAAGQPEGAYTDINVSGQLPSGVKTTSNPRVSYRLKAETPSEAE